jgi:Anti-sigma-K factor rskA
LSTHPSCSLSGELVSYIVGECSEEELFFMQDHLSTCSACLKEMEEIQEGWDLIPYKLDDVEVPPDLKEEVLNSIFQPEKIEEYKVPIALNKKFVPHRIFHFGWVAAALFFVLIGVIYNNITLREQLTELENQVYNSTEVIQVFTLKSDNVAQGNALLFKQGEKKQLVFHVNGLARTKGTEAYQAWLIHDGKRRSAGVFQVDDDGNGFLTYNLTEDELPFEAIGISLEPDEKGTQPRGQKVLGT